MYHSQYQFGIVRLVDVECLDVDQPGGPQVSDEDLYDAEVQAEAGGKLGHRDRLAGEVDDRLQLWGEVRHRTVDPGDDLALHAHVRITRHPTRGEHERAGAGRR